MQQQSLADRLSREIVATIRADNLRPGQAIPPARQLADRFKVTVPTIREALRRLEATSIVELRHGSGTYVGEAVDRQFLLNPFRPEASLASALELAEARLTLEPAVAAEAARSHTAEQLAALESTLGNALRPATQPSAVASFHAEMARASNNPTLGELIGTLLDVRQAERQQIRAIYSDRQRDLDEHQGIFNAVAARDTEVARTLTATHLTHIRDHLRAALDEEGEG